MFTIGQKVRFKVHLDRPVQWQGILTILQIHTDDTEDGVLVGNVAGGMLNEFEDSFEPVEEQASTDS